MPAANELQSEPAAIGPNGDPNPDQRRGTANNNISAPPVTRSTSNRLLKRGPIKPNTKFAANSKNNDHAAEFMGNRTCGPQRVGRKRIAKIALHSKSAIPVPV